MIAHSIEIDRSAEEVFAYLDQPERHGEWQQAIVHAHMEAGESMHVGTRVHEVRRVGRREQDTSYEITEYDPPHRSSFRGIAGPVRPVGTVTVEPSADGTKSRVSIEMDLVGVGMGKLFAPLARMQVRREVAESQQRLKERLEQGA